MNKDQFYLIEKYKADRKLTQFREKFDPIICVCGFEGEAPIVDHKRGKVICECPTCKKLISNSRPKGRR